MGDTLLLFDRMRLSHLRTHAPVKGKAQEPGSLTVMDFLIPSPTLGGILAGHCCLPMQVQVSCHPER